MNRITEADPIASTAREGDGELLSRFLDRRDDSAFAELLTRHGSMVFGVCLRRLGQCQDAEDAYQAVFLALATHGRKLVDRTTVGPWLYAVARQVSTKSLRSRSRRRWVFWGKTPEPASPPPKEAEVDLDAALASLSESERSAVILCHLEGLSRAEAAKALAIPEGTLSTRLARALEKLRRKLGKPPLAVLTAAMLVLVPEPLPAGTVGLVRHLRDGTLEDWASPSVLDLYRKALPMRLLDRLGPALVSVLAAVLILVGANFGWQLINAQQPADGKQPPQPAVAPQGGKKSFAAALDEIQTKKEQPAQTQQSVVRFQIQSVASTNPERRKTFPWEIRVQEVIAGIPVEHRINTWEAIPILLKQIVSSGHKRVDVTLAPEAVTRLEANQILNACKRAGFQQVDYHGPKPFLGSSGDLNKAAGLDVPSIDLSLDLVQSKELLPDWTNGWVIARNEVHRLENVVGGTQIDPADLHTIIMSWGGARGPAAGLLEVTNKLLKSTQGGLGGGGGGFEGATKQDATPASSLARQIEEHKHAATAPRIAITMVPSQNSMRALADTRTSISQKFATGDTWVESPAIGPVRELIRRSLSSNVGHVEVKVGIDGFRGQTVDPLHVNAVLNACKRSGAKTVAYTGQKIITGTSKEYAVAPIGDSPNALPIVNVTFSLENLEGELPDETNGWSVVRVGGLVYIVSDEARKRELQSMTTYDAEIMRLAQLPLGELEREIARKPSELRNRWRKSVEEVKAKLRKE